MTIHRWAAKRDLSEPSIRDGLHKAGFLTWQRLPADLLVWHPVYGFDICECKTGNAKTRKDQEEQLRFLAVTQAPIVNTAEQAIEVLTLRGLRR